MQNCSHLAKMVFKRKFKQSNIRWHRRTCGQQRHAVAKSGLAPKQPQSKRTAYLTRHGHDRQTLISLTLELYLDSVRVQSPTLMKDCLLTICSKSPFTRRTQKDTKCGHEILRCQENHSILKFVTGAKLEVQLTKRAMPGHSANHVDIPTLSHQRNE